MSAQNRTQRRVRTFLSLIVMAGIAGLVATLAILLISHPRLAVANTNELGYAEAQYPFIVKTKLDNCTLCHTEVGSYLFNPYGQKYNDTPGTPAEAFQTIENLDSDGDGYTNIQELRAGTEPGDPKDHPSYPLLEFLPLVEDLPR